MAALTAITTNMKILQKYLANDTVLTMLEFRYASKYHQQVYDSGQMDPEFFHGIREQARAAYRACNDYTPDDRNHATLLRYPANSLTEQKGPDWGSVHADPGLLDEIKSRAPGQCKDDLFYYHEIARMTANQKFRYRTGKMTLTEVRELLFRFKDDRAAEARYLAATRR